jgi:protein TonB
LTTFTIPTGSGAGFAGGQTSSEGTSTRAIERGADSRGAAFATGITADGDLSAPVRLPASEWECPWPREAEAASIDEASAVIRVTVDANGHPELVALVSSPGHGFGDAALACARRARFEPARDRAGNAVRARSGPIRVQFTR